MDIDNFKWIQKVEAPPFLFTRIQQKIESEKLERMPNKMAVILNFCIVIVFIINVMVFIGSKTKSVFTESYAQSIHLISNNSLYE